MATLKSTGLETAVRARSAAPASMAALTGGAVTFTGSAVAPGVRTTWPSVRTTSSAEASRSSRLPPRSGNHLDPETAAYERRALRASVHIGGDPVEGVLERGIRHGETWEHFRAEHAGADATEATQRTEAVAGTAGSGNRPAPIGLDAELVRSERVGRRACDELDGLAGALLEERLELGDSLAACQAADVDSGHIRTRRELASRAREGEADEDGERRNGNEETDHDGGPRTSAPTSAAARCVQRRFGAHRSANSRGEPHSPGRDVPVKMWHAFATEDQRRSYGLADENRQ